MRPIASVRLENIRVRNEIGSRAPMASERERVRERARRASLAMRAPAAAIDDVMQRERENQTTCTDDRR